MTTDLQPNIEGNRPAKPLVLGIFDLIVATTAIALFFGLMENTGRSGWFFPTEDSVFAFLSRMTFATQYGLAMAATYWFYRQNRDTGKICHHPGHWILLSICIFSVVFIPISIWAAVQDTQFVSGSISICFLAMLEVAQATVFAVGFFNVSIRWKIVFGPLFVSYVAIAVTTFGVAVPQNKVDFLWPAFTVLQYVWTIGLALGSLLLMVAAVTDLVKKDRRDWLHWTGLFVFLLGTVFGQILSMIYIRFYMPQ